MPSTRISSATRTNRFLGRCEPCVRPIGEENETYFGDKLRTTCPECGGRVILERLYGTTIEMICDSRCEGAIGPHCECSCGGANHGGRFFETGEALASAIMAYRATTERRRAAAQQRVETRRANRERQLAERQAAYREQNAQLFSQLDNYNGANSFVLSIRSQAQSGRELSERQISAVTQTLTREAQVSAQRAQERAEAMEVPEGNQTIIGTILSTRVDDNPYGPGGIYKMLVRDRRGFKVWSTVPSSLIPNSEAWRTLNGRTITFQAQVVRSRNDATFGIAKRPRNGSVVPTN